MSWQAVKWALQQAPMLRTAADKNDSTARFVLVALAEHSSGNPEISFPSIATLRFFTGLDMKTVQRALQRLAGARLITDVGSKGDGVTCWRLETDQRRPDTDRDAITTEVEAHRERDRRRKRKPESSGALSPESTQDVPDSKSGVRGVKSGIRDFKSGIPDAEPARTDQGTDQEPNTPSPGKPGGVDGVLLHLPLTSSRPQADTTKKDRQANDYTPEFEAFWKSYPKRNGARAGKFPASREWAKALKLTTVEMLMSSVRRYATQCGDFPKDAERWLKNRMWEDFAPAAGDSQVITFDSLRASADAPTAARLIRVPWADPDQHPDDTTPRAEWLRARRVEFIDRHRDAIQAALKKAS